jgi:hypothetical protein
MRRHSTVIVAAVLVAACYASAVDDALPGVPISQEHHHHLVLENSFVKAYEVEVAPHESTLMHQHLHDYVYIVLGDAEFTNAVAGKAEVRVKQPDLAVNFSPGPFAHVAVNNADTPFRNITIELLHPQGEVKKSYPSIRAALDTGAADDKTGRQATVLETDDVRVVAVAVAPKSSWSPPRDDRNRLVVRIDKIHDTSGLKEKNSPFPGGMLAWVPAGKGWSMSNTAVGIDKLMVLEFKGPAGK